MLTRIKNLSEFGILTDISPQELPNNSFSAGENIRFNNKAVEKFTGHSIVFGTPVIVPYWLLPVTTVSSSFWVYCGLSQVYVYDGTTHFPLTRIAATKNISGITRSGTTATATSTAHGYSNSDVISISGASQSDYNITAIISNVAANTFDYTVANSPVTPATGTIIANKNTLYSAAAATSWNGGVIEGIPIINNGVNDPQMWSPIGTSQRLTSLTWDSGNTWLAKGHTCAVIRTYKDFLVALDVTKSGNQNSRLVKWSTSGLPGAVPSTWDETDATEDAGEVELAQTIGACIDGETLGDLFVIYKEDSTWGMQYIGGDAIFRFYLLYGTLSILTRRCVKQFEGKHFVLSQGDVMVHDGVSKPISIIDQRRRDELFNNIDSDNYTLCFVTPNYSNQEMWISYPESGKTACTKMMVWNWRENSWGSRDLPDAYDIAYGVLDDSNAITVWNDDTGFWNDDTEVWNQRTFNPSDKKMLMAATNLYLLNDTNQFDGTSFNSNIERTGLFFEDAETIKHVTAIWVRSVGTGILTITVGSQMNPGEAVTWKPGVTMSVGTERKINLRVTGRYIAYKIESSGNDNWKILGVAFDINSAGLR